MTRATEQALAEWRALDPERQAAIRAEIADAEAEAGTSIRVDPRSLDAARRALADLREAWAADAADELADAVQDLDDALAWAVGERVPAAVDLERADADA